MVTPYNRPALAMVFFIVCNNDELVSLLNSLTILAKALNVWRRPNGAIYLIEHTKMGMVFTKVNMQTKVLFLR